MTTTEQLEDLIRRVGELARGAHLILQSKGRGWMLEIHPTYYNRVENFRILADTVEEAIQKADQHIRLYENPPKPQGYE